MWKKPEITQDEDRTGRFVRREGGLVDRVAHDKFCRDVAAAANVTPSVVEDQVLGALNAEAQEATEDDINLTIAYLRAHRRD